MTTSLSWQSNSMSIFSLSKLSNDAPSTPAEMKTPRAVPSKETSLNNHAPTTLIVCLILNRVWSMLSVRSWRCNVGLAPGEGFEPSRPQGTTGSLCSTPGLGSSCWDLPRTRLGNPGVGQLYRSIVQDFLARRHKDSHGFVRRGWERARFGLLAPHFRVCSARHEHPHDVRGNSFFLMDYRLTGECAPGQRHRLILQSQYGDS